MLDVCNNKKKNEEEEKQASLSTNKQPAKIYYDISNGKCPKGIILYYKITTKTEGEKEHWSVGIKSKFTELPIICGVCTVYCTCKKMIKHSFRCLVDFLFTKWMHTHPYRHTRITIHMKPKRLMHPEWINMKNEELSHIVWYFIRRQFAMLLYVSHNFLPNFFNAIFAFFSLWFSVVFSVFCCILAFITRHICMWIQTVFCVCFPFILSMISFPGRRTRSAAVRLDYFLFGAFFENWVHPWFIHHSALCNMYYDCSAIEPYNHTANDIAILLHQHSITSHLTNPNLFFDFGY